PQPKRFARRSRLCSKPHNAL
ncbi:methyl-accepting chemotaxis (MCP) signaling domain protein, partial [Vibrio parahaemolyticus VPTS-2010]